MRPLRIVTLLAILAWLAGMAPAWIWMPTAVPTDRTHNALSWAFFYTLAPIELGVAAIAGCIVFALFAALFEWALERPEDETLDTPQERYARGEISLEQLEREA